MATACVNGCGRPPFKQFPTCCTYCKGPAGPHAKDCEAKASAVAAQTSSLLLECYDKVGGNILAILKPAENACLKEIGKGRDEVIEAQLDEKNRIHWCQGPGAPVEFSAVHSKTKWLRVIRATDGDLTTWRCYSEKPPKEIALYCPERHTLNKEYGTSGWFRHLASSKLCGQCDVEIRKGALRWCCSTCDFNICVSCAESLMPRTAGGSAPKSLSTIAAGAGGRDSGAYWDPINHGEPIPRDAVVAGSTKSDGIVWVGRFNGEAGKINSSDGTKDGKMHNFWGNSSGQQKAVSILRCPEVNCEWLRMERGQPIPPGAVQAGQTDKDGMVYVGRFDGEAGKINIQNGTMYNFWGHKAGRQTVAEILTTTNNQEAADVSPSRAQPEERRDRGFTAHRLSEHAQSKKPDEQVADALQRLKRLVVHGDLSGAQRMFTRAQTLKVQPSELQKIEAEMKKLEAEGVYALLAG